MAFKCRNKIESKKELFVSWTQEITNYLRFCAETGISGFDCTAKSLETVRGWGSRRPLRPETLDAIRNELGNCRHCMLYKERNNIVFGAGDQNARLVFVGEGPGFEEDQQGKPFVGASGRLFTKIIQAMNLTREKVYICNILKCRPPGNRNPRPDEIKNCFPFLQRQISAVKPDFICALGTFAAQTLLDTTAPISELRGRFFDYQGIKLMPTYHPSFLLRNPSYKRYVWEDMQKLMQTYGL